MATPAADQFEAVLQEKFPGIRFGRYNCRKISGSSTYSQHSWNNARDIYPPLSIRYADSKEEYQAWLDEVDEFISSPANFEMLNLRLVLWRVKDHYNHIHADFWPHGEDTPMCDGAPTNTWSYPDGSEKEGAHTELLNVYEEPQEEVSVINLHALVDAGFDAGLAEPDTPEGRQYWHILAEDNPLSDEWYDFFFAILGGNK